MAATLGAELPVSEPVGSMIVDIGGGTTEIAVISLGGIVEAKSLRIGGDHFDAAISNYIKKKHNLIVGFTTCEKIKHEIAAALPQSKENSRATMVRGRDAVTGLPRKLKLVDNEINKALEPLIEQIWNAVMLLLDTIPPDLAADIHEHGLILTGGGAAIRDLDKALSNLTGVSVVVAENPKYCVAFGTQMAMNLGRKFAHRIQTDP